MLHFDNPGYAGYLPRMLDPADPRSPQEQLMESYAHGGGWNSFKGFKLVKKGSRYALKYPGDPAMKEISRAVFREKLVVLFEYDWLAVIEQDETFDVARID